MRKNIQIIGSGFSSMAAACYLAQAGHQVTVYEQNSTVGGRARQLKRDGFTFDIGPTWYWMPDIFERFFADFGKKPSDYYGLKKLAPAYCVYFADGTQITISDAIDEIAQTFESIEPGSGAKLKKFIESARENYEIAIGDLVYRPGESFTELITWETFKKCGLFLKNISTEMRRQFKNEKLIRILEFPVLFLGAKPSDTPYFYNFMNYADFGLGTWHPENGMYGVVQAMEKLGRELGVQFVCNSKVSEIVVENNQAVGLVVNGAFMKSDVVLSGADYHHTETLLPEYNRQYTENYWDKKTFAPSSLLFYVGFDKKINNVEHHTLFFDADFDAHASAIYDHPHWPKDPMFYASFPSITDANVAPQGCEAAIFLIPLAPGLEDSEQMREDYFNLLLDRLEIHTKQSLKSHVLFKESFGINDFKEQYNSYKGNAYGLANTLLQTAFLRPGLKSKKVNQLYFTGQLTVPGPGVPPALISGKLAAGLIQKNQ